MFTKTETTNKVEDKYIVEFEHFRESYNKGGLEVFKRNSKKSNTTLCTIFKKEDDTIIPMSVAGAICHKDDNFDKGVGRKIAFSKAVRYISSKEDRKLLWNWFKGYSPKSFKNNGRK